MDQDYWLVVGGSGEDLGLAGWDDSVAGNELGHDTSGSLNTESKWVHVHENDVLSSGLTRKDTTLNSGTECNSLIRVDTLAGLLASKVLLDELDDLRNTGGTTDQDDLVDGRLVSLSVAEDTLDGVHGGAEEILAQLLEAGTGDRGVEVDTLEQRVDLDRSLGRRGQGALSPLAGSAETTESTSVASEICSIVSTG